MVNVIAGGFCFENIQPKMQRPSALELVDAMMNECLNNTTGYFVITLVEQRQRVPLRLLYPLNLDSCKLCTTRTNERRVWFPDAPDDEVLPRKPLAHPGKIINVASKQLSMNN